MNPKVTIRVQESTPTQVRCMYPMVKPIVWLSTLFPKTSNGIKCVWDPWPGQCTTPWKPWTQSPGSLFHHVTFHPGRGFNVDVTMLPVGDESARNQLDSQLKAGREGFQSTLFEAINMCVSEKKVDNVSLLYNSMGDIVSNQSKIAIVHELGTCVNREVVKRFLDVTGTMK